MHADTVVLNGKVVTVDQEFSTVAALAITGDRITAVGSTEDIRALAGPDTRVIDADGRLVLPGFIDAHPHTIHRALVDLGRPALAGAGSIAEIADRIGVEAARTATEGWIVTTPLGDPPDHFHLPERYTENRWPTRSDLDVAAPDHPVYIPTPAYWPHPAIFNTRALARLGITADTPDEPGVRVERDAAGEPTGVVHGLHIFQPSRLFGTVMSTVPFADAPTRQDAMLRAFTENLAVGITACYEGHGNGFIPDLRELADRLPHRVVAAYDVPAQGSLAEIDAWMASRTDAHGESTGPLHTRGITVGIDGPPQFGLSLMYQPYRGPLGETTSGREGVALEKLTEIARLAVRHDLRLNIVAAGDRACALVADALSTVHSEAPLSGRHWVLQHFFNPTLEQIGVLKAMGIVVQTYTSIEFSRGEQVYIDRLGGESWRTVTPLRWWLDAGIPVGLASDGGHYNPLFQIWTALRRVDGRTGRDMLTPAKTITRREAITAYTMGSATVLGMADRIGSLEPGKFADLTIVDRDILDCPVDDIRDGKAVLTVLGGTVVYDQR